jgi:ribosomal protein S18 acetylase RimI-like enzyme
MQRWTIRPYQVTDRARIRRLTVEGFDGISIEQLIDHRFPVAARMDWAERKSQQVLDEVDSHPEGCFVAESEGEVIGYVTTTVAEARLQGRVADMVVDARFRGHGIGRALIQVALADFRRRGLRLARIEALADNEPACGLYRQLGFQELSRQVRFAMPLEPTD